MQCVETLHAWFSTFLENALVSYLNCLMLIRMGRFCHSTLGGRYMVIVLPALDRALLDPGALAGEYCFSRPLEQVSLP